MQSQTVSWSREDVGQHPLGRKVHYEPVPVLGDTAADPGHHLPGWPKS